MKICMVGCEIAPSKGDVIVGGVANSVIRLSQGLIEEGDSVNIITSRPRIFNENFQNSLFPIHQISIHNRYPSFGYGVELSIRALRKINQLDKSEHFDIIHGHSGESSIGIIPNVVGKLMNKPSIHSLYCPIRSHDRYVHHFLSNIDLVIAISKNVGQSLENNQIPSQKIRIVPPPIDTLKYNPTISGEKLRTKLGINAEDQLLLFIGNLTRTKGIDILLDAMKNVVEVFPDVKLVMTLEMPHSNYSSRATEINNKIQFLGLSNNIIKLGIVDNMAELIAASNVLIIPFLDTYEPSDYPLPLLEAMSMGKLVIATRIGGIPEIVQDMENGFLIDPNDVDSLSHSILKVLTDIKIQKVIGKNAAKLIADTFSIKTVSKKMREIYEEVTRK